MKINLHGTLYYFLYLFNWVARKFLAFFSILTCRRCWRRRRSRKRARALCALCCPSGWTRHRAAAIYCWSIPTWTSRRRTATVTQSASTAMPHWRSKSVWWMRQRSPIRAGKNNMEIRLIDWLLDWIWLIAWLDLIDWIFYADTKCIFRITPAPADIVAWVGSNSKCRTVVFTPSYSGMTLARRVPGCATTSWRPALWVCSGSYRSISWLPWRKCSFPSAGWLLLTPRYTRSVNQSINRSFEC